MCLFLGRRGVETDLLSLVGARDSALVAVSERSASRIRVLCADEARANLCRDVFPFDDGFAATNLFDRLRTHGRGLLSSKHRLQLESFETNRIARSALRRDYAGIGLFPKEDDPFYFLNDFATDLARFMPNPPEGAVLLSGDAAKSPQDVPRLVALATGIDGISLGGAPFHAFLAKESTVREINRLGVVSIVAVVAIGLVLFGSARFILPTLLTLGAGFLAGSAAVFLFALPARPHALVFLFGMTLLGLGVDYCYHGLDVAERRDSAGLVRNLRTALVTTCLSFVPLLFSSVAVLRQMAVFTIVGLVAVCTAVVLWFARSR